MKRKSSLFHQCLAVSLLMASISISANAQESKTINVEYDGATYNLYYNEESGTIVPEKAVLQRYVEEAFQTERSFTVPTVVNTNLYNGESDNEYKFPVTEIATSAFEGCQKLTALTIPGEVKLINDRAFYSCPLLEKVTLGEGITTLGTPDEVYGEGSVFENCASLTSVDLPSTLRSMRMAFCDTPLKSITLPASVEDLKGAFINTALTSITIPKSVKSLYATFSGCQSLESVVIADADIKESERAFEGCIKLKSVDLGNTITTIGRGMFQNCSSIESITLPPSVRIIDKFAFASCTAMQRIVMPAVESIGSNAFQSSGLAQVEFPTTLKEIGGAAFNKTNLTTVVFPQSLEIIERSAFASCANLSTITLSSSVKTIEKEAFRNCKSLTTCYSYIEEPFDTGEDAFYYNKSMYETLYVPKGTSDKYKEKKGWRFKYIVEMGDDTSIASPTGESCSVSSYSLGGVKLSKPRQGLIITKGKKWLKK